MRRARAARAARGSASGAASLEILRGRRRVARVAGIARYGTNRLVWRARGVRPGRYRLRLTVVGADGRRATDAVTVRVVR